MAIKARPPRAYYTADTINAARAAAQATPNSDPNLPALLAPLEHQLNTRYNDLGSLDDLDEIIQLSRRSLEITPEGDPDLVRVLNNLGNKLVTRLDRRRGQSASSDIDEGVRAVQTAADVVSATPAGGGDAPMVFANLGNALHRRFDEQGSLRDIVDAAKAARRALELTPAEDVEAVQGLLPGLWGKLDALFERLESYEDRPVNVQAR